MTTPLRPDEVAALTIAMARATDRNERARLGQRILAAYRDLFAVALEAQAQAERVAAAAQTLTEMGQALVEAGVTSLADPDAPLTLPTEETA